VAVLADLVALRADGLRAPLPIAGEASLEYAVRRHAGGTVEEALDAAGKAWAGRFGDVTDRHLAYVLGTPPPFERMTAEPDDGPEGTRFGALAVRLWAPLLACESLGAP
jgi:exodeoxyribonuclease V gamma subunit